VEKKDSIAAYPWSPGQAPLIIKTRAKRIPSWQLYNEMTGPIPYSVTYQMEVADEADDITLIPYGCSHLRIAQFPVVE
jgi:hypothetical protein